MKHLEPWMWDELETLLPSHTDKVAVDIGAHEGEWTVPLSERYAKVWSFEAQMWLTTELAKTVPDNVTVIPRALSGKVESRQFTHYADSAHFSGEFNASRGFIGQVFLSCMPLDVFNLKHVGLIKVDVEGMEVDVLHGAERTVNSERPLVVVEVHTVANGNTLQELLRSWQYDLRMVRHPYYKPNTENAQRHYWLIGVPND